MSTLTEQSYKMIENAINNSKDILNLKDGWDEDTSVAPSKNTLDRAITWLKKYADEMSVENMQLLGEPSINPCSDGSIEVYWRGNSCRVLVSFPADRHQKPTFYADGTPMLGRVNLRRLL
jgi:hypothetical protein